MEDVRCYRFQDKVIEDKCLCFFAKIVLKIKKSDEKHLSVSFSTESSYCGVGRGTAVFL